MVKKYYPGESKEQRKARKAREKSTGVKEKLQVPKVENPPKAVVTTNPPPAQVVERDPVVNKDRWAKGFEPYSKRYIACLKHGNKYSAEYVNKLYFMAKRNLTLPFEFVCFTENPADLDKNIRVQPLPRRKVSGWWHKPGFFDRDLPIQGTVLYLDLDVIIFRNIDKLFTYQPGKFCIIRDFNRSNVPGYHKFNSSCFRLETGQHPYVYEEFMKAPEQYSKKFHGDQDWLYHMIKTDYQYWPDNWLQSYKWEMRKRAPMQRVNGVRNFVSPGRPDILDDTAIAVFHGEPNPHNCVDPWCKENWY